MNEQIILDIIKKFYDIAKNDILIGYHFRVIEDFEEHIPRIADFWNLQLNGKVKNKHHLPFSLIQAHKALNVNKGELFRWQKLFNDNLDTFLQNKIITIEQKNHFEKKVDFFKERLLEKLFNSNI